MAEETDSAHQLLTRVANEYATVQLELDTTEANGPRVVIKSLRDHHEVRLDPLALSLLCHVDEHVLDLLADISRDSSARWDFAQWLQSRDA